MGEPARLPSFRGLANEVAQHTGEELIDNEPEDRFLGRLNSKGVKVHERAAEVLSKGAPEPTDLHRDLLRLYRNPASVRIVTTNFDTLFEKASTGVFRTCPEVFQTPTLPFRRAFRGMVHIHGSIERADDMVLTDADLGYAYLIEGSARRFLVELFGSFTILFVGYSHRDTVMTYLARALQGRRTEPRFAITNDTDSHRWQILGIKPVIYRSSSSDDHHALYEGINGLVKYAGRSLSDWRSKITEIAENPPSRDGEEMDLVEDALADPRRAGFFADAAAHVGWIDWLDKRKHLDRLFSTDDPAGLGGRDEQLARWLARKFVPDHSDELFLLIALHDMRLHPDFWSELAWTISSANDQRLDTAALSRWVSLLLTTIPPNPNHRDLYRLGKRCIEVQLTGSLLDIFGVMAASRLTLEQSPFWPGDDTEPQTRARPALLSDHYAIDAVWKQGLKTALDHVAEPLLTDVVRNLTQQHHTLRSWRSANRNWDPISYGRSAIEPHEQDEYREPIDVLIDAARDCLEHLTTKQPTVATYWCDRFTEAEAPLLRRLAVHTLPTRNDLTPDEKVDWLLANIGLHDFSAHHETFQALRTLYPAANAAKRKDVIEAVLSYAWPQQEDQDRNRHTAYQHFNWIHWLHNADPECEIAEQALRRVWEANPDFQTRDHPDLTHYVEVGSTIPRRAWRCRRTSSATGQGMDYRSTVVS